MKQAWVSRSVKTLNYAEFKTRNCPVCLSDHWKVTVKGSGCGNIARCETCGHFYLNPPIPGDILREIYENEYFMELGECEWVSLVEKWTADPAGPYQRTIAWLMKDHGPPREIFEVGCGIGSFLGALKKTGYSVRGLDPSAEAVRLAKKRYDIDIDRGFLGQDGAVNFQGLFPVVCSFEVIEHAEDPVLFLRQCGQMLEPGGILVLSTPNFELFPKLGRYYVDTDKQEHIQFFTRTTLTALLEKTGFKPREMSTINPVLFGERWQKKLTPYWFMSGAWQSIRSFKVVQAFKRSLIKNMNRVRTPSDLSGSMGNTILVFAEKV